MPSEEDTATLLILALPPGALCGIDLLSFTTSPRFCGLKNVSANPKTPHFLYTASTPSLSTRHGIWLLPSPREVLVKKWDSDREELAEVTDEVERTLWESRIPKLWDEGLTPYRPSADEAEREGVREELVDCVSPSLLSRITGGERNEWVISTSSSMKGDMEVIPNLTGGTAGDEKELVFMPIDLKRTWREGAIGRERTDAVRDRSWALGDLVERYCAGKEENVVGEMQVAFLGGLVLGNYSCREQWRRVLGLVLTCQKAVGEREGFFVRILRVLRAQLGRRAEAEGGVFDFAGEDGTWLLGLLRGFRRGLEDVDGARNVRTELEVLVEFVRREFGWELNDEFVRRGMVELEDGEQVEMEMDDLEGEDERGEYAPVIVDLGECGGDTTPLPLRLR